jgi:hypothetical protein
MNAPQYAPNEFSEVTGPWVCRACGNRTRFIGVDKNGCPGPEGCGECSNRGMDCTHSITLRQPVRFVGEHYPNGWVEGSTAEPYYDAFREGPPGTEIGYYTSVECDACGALLWTEDDHHIDGGPSQ